MMMEEFRAKARTKCGNEFLRKSKEIHRLSWIAEQIQELRRPAMSLLISYMV